MSVYLKIDYADDNDLEFDYQNNLTASKFFGEIAVPDLWFEKNEFSPDELFVCQINLSEIKHTLLPEGMPENGMLFFFLEIKKSGYSAIVRYYDGDMNSAVCFNDEFESEINVIDELLISITEGESESVGQMFFTDENTEGDVCLLRVDYFENDSLLPVEGDAYFLISKEDFAALSFGKVRLKIVNYSYLF